MKENQIDRWSVDEVHFQQYGSPCRMWIPPQEKEPVLVHYLGRKSEDCFGAVRIRDGKFGYRREEKMFDGNSYFSFLKQLKRESRHGDHRIILRLDHARDHHSRVHKEWRTSRDKKFHGEFLPPYSPDLNLIERVWKMTRHLGVHKTYFPTFLEVILAVEKPFDPWMTPNDTLKNLCKVELTHQHIFMTLCIIASNLL